MSAKKELEDKIKRKNKVIEEQQLVLDEYRNTIKFLEIRLLRLNKCQCKNALFTRTVDADFNCLCGRCGKPI